MLTGILAASLSSSYLVGPRPAWAPAQVAVAACAGLGLTAGLSAMIRLHDDRLDATWLATTPVPRWVRDASLVGRALPCASLAIVAVVALARAGGSASSVATGAVQAVLLVFGLVGVGIVVGRAVPLRLGVLLMGALGAAAVIASRASSAVRALVPWDAGTDLTVSNLAAPPDHLLYVALAGALCLGTMSLVVSVGVRRPVAWLVAAAALGVYGSGAVLVHRQLTAVPATDAVGQVVTGDAATDCSEVEGVLICTLPALAVPEAERESTARTVAALTSRIGATSPPLLQSAYTAPPGSGLEGAGLQVEVPADGRVLLPLTGPEDRDQAAVAGAATGAVGLPSAPSSPWSSAGSQTGWCRAASDAAAAALYLVASTDPVVASAVDGVVATDEVVSRGPRTTILIGWVEVDTGAVLLTQQLRALPPGVVDRLVRDHLDDLRHQRDPLTIATGISPDHRALRAEGGAPACP